MNPNSMNNHYGGYVTSDRGELANIFQATGWDPRPQSFNEGDAWMGAKLEFNGSDNFANNFTNNFANEANANNNFLVLFLIILLVVLVSMVLIMVAKKRKPKIEFGGRCVMGSNGKYLIFDIGHFLR